MDFNNLVNKLRSKFNFSYQSCCLIILYLKERIQMVKINGCFSEEAHIKYGVPQGSIILFLLYINDIKDVPQNGQIMLFADDSSMITIAITVSSLIQKVKSDLNLIHQYCKSNHLYLLMPKTKNNDS